jgi:hypothetical protein
MRKSRFSKRRPFIKTSGVNLDEMNHFNMGGLNTYLPDELMKDEDSPFAKNFRRYETDTDEARVCISKRKGQTFYSVPVGETNRGEITSTTGAAEKDITGITRYAQSFTVSAGGRLTKIDLKLDGSTGTAPLRVDVYTDIASAPGVLMASSSISKSAMPTSSNYASVRFIEAPTVATSTTYWLVVWRQEEGVGTYTISSNTSATTALISNNAGNNWTATDYCLNYKVYVSTDGGVKGHFRYYNSTSPNEPTTLFIAGTNLYSVNESTGAVTSINSAFSADAKQYRFMTIEDKVYIVNGYDDPKIWNGTTLSTASGAVAQFTAIGSGSAKAIDVAIHKQRIWYLLSDNNITYSDDLAFDTFSSSLNFIYAPSPKHPDKAIRFIPFQDNMIVFTRNGKWIIYGSDRQTIVIRESTGVKGLVGPNALWKDSSYLYFISDDDVYRFNGGVDEGLGLSVKRLLDNTATDTDMDLVVYDGKIRIYYTPSGQSHNRNCLVYDLDYKTWMHDTDIFIGQVAVFNNQTDENVLVHGSSLVGALYCAETGYSDLGKPIDFEYRTKYFSYGHPSRKNRLKRLYVFFRPGESDYSVHVKIATDDISTPQDNIVYLGTNSAKWGNGSTWGGGNVWGGGTLKPARISVAGQARQHQVRIIQNGVDNPIELLGMTQYYQVRKPL